MVVLLYKVGPDRQRRWTVTCGGWSGSRGSTVIQAHGQQLEHDPVTFLFNTQEETNSESFNEMDHNKICKLFVFVQTVLCEPKIQEVYVGFVSPRFLLVDEQPIEKIKTLVVIPS